MIFFFKDPAKKEREKKKGNRKGRQKGRKRKTSYCSVNINILEREISGTPKSAWTTFLRPTALQSGRHSPAPR